MKKSTNKVYEIITNKVIEGLKERGMDWFKPFKGGSDYPPMSYGSKTPYKGINYWILSGDMIKYDYTSPVFITYKQMKAAGGELVKDYNSHQVVYWNVSYSVKQPDGTYKYYSLVQLKRAGYKPSDNGVNMHFSPRYYTVYNLDQVEGVEDFTENTKKEVIEGTIFEAIPDAEVVWDGYKKKPTLEHGGSRAYYKPDTHHIQMPEQNDFVSSDDYYKVLFHEMIHSTGHKSILNRFKENKEQYADNKQEYSFEELVAELGAMFLVGVTGLEPKNDDVNSQAYINGWIEHLENNPKEILFASTKSQKAVEHILNA